MMMFDENYFGTCCDVEEITLTMSTMFGVGAVVSYLQGRKFYKLRISS